MLNKPANVEDYVNEHSNGFITENNELIRLVENIAVETNTEVDLCHAFLKFHLALREHYAEDLH